MITIVRIAKERTQQSSLAINLLTRNLRMLLPWTRNKKRDWGKGFACAGRSKTNTNVVSNFKGQIPGTEVGQMWLMRIQLSENGIHRPPVAGIHANEKDGAMSIVLNGGYEDDEDHGDWFTYTGLKIHVYFRYPKF